MKDNKTPANQTNSQFGVHANEIMSVARYYQFGLPVQKIISVTRDRHGYDVVKAEVGGPEYGGPWLEMTAAFNWRGEYIGNVKTARQLVDKRGILPQLRTAGSSVCSIGFSLKDGKWYGWSHRAIFGFKGRDAKRKACRFAESVS